MKYDEGLVQDTFALAVVSLKAGDGYIRVDEICCTRVSHKEVVRVYLRTECLVLNVMDIKQSN